MFSFEDVLGMASVFSEQACPSLKIEYAFRIYGRYLGCGGGAKWGGERGQREPAMSEIQPLLGLCDWDSLALYEYISLFLEYYEIIEPTENLGSN